MVDTERLAEIKEEIKQLLEEAHDQIRNGEDYLAVRRAESYWYSHIRVSLDKEHGCLGGSMWTMQDTIDEIEESNCGEDDECPGCGCQPGDGITDDCEHPDGCGWAKRTHCDGDVEGGRTRWAQ